MPEKRWVSTGQYACPRCLGSGEVWKPMGYMPKRLMVAMHQERPTREQDRQLKPCPNCGGKGMLR